MVDITVVGSVNLDLVARAPRLPVPGETVTDADFSIHPGGKGANQALAAQRLGAQVTLVARVGSDANSAPALALLRPGGVELTDVTTDPEAPTGVALIAVDHNGENQIVVAPGANRTINPDAVAGVEVADAVICQLEIPTAVVEAAAQHRRGLFVLNAAPVRPLPPELVSRCDVIVVNEVEHEALRSDLSLFSGLIALTLGADGAVLLRDGVEIARSTPPPVTVIDTVGAGDTFVAALTVALAEGRSPAEALTWATAAGSLATTRHGAQPSLPTRHDVDELTGRR